MPLSFGDVGGYFCVLLMSLPKVYPIVKQVKPKLMTAIRSTILIWRIPPFKINPPENSGGFLCDRRVTVLRFTSVVAKRVPLAPCNPPLKD